MTDKATTSNVLALIEKELDHLTNSDIAYKVMSRDPFLKQRRQAAAEVLDELKDYIRRLEDGEELDTILASIDKKYEDDSA